MEGEPGTAAVGIESLTWMRFRCHVVVSGDPAALTTDLVLGDPAGESVAQSPKPVDKDGTVSLVLADDEHEDAALVLVIKDAEGRVVAFRETRVGETS